MTGLLTAPGELLGPLDVALLARIVASGEQDDDDNNNNNNNNIALLLEVDVVAGPIHDPQFRHPFADRLDVAEVAEQQPTDPSENARLRLNVTQSLELRLVLIFLPDFNHT